MKQFRLLLSKPTLDLPELALHAARLLDYPRLQTDAYLAEIDALAQRAVGGALDLGDEQARAERLAQFLYNEIPLRGDTLNYADPRNSFLNQVLDRGLGIPISLSIIYIAIAKKLGMHAYGIGLPGHFIAGVGDSNNVAYVDPFNGKRLSGSDCARLVRETTGRTSPFQTEWLQPTNDRDILLRLLNNLRIIYTREEQWDKATITLDLIDCVYPKQRLTVRDRALIAFAQSNYLDASRQLNDYLETNPNGIDDKTIRLAIAPAIEKWASNN